MELAQQSLIDEDFERADELYTAYLAEHPNDATALASRAAVYLKLSKPSQALQDATKASTLKPDLEVAWYRQGLAAFALEDYARAKQSFTKGKQLLGEAPEPGGRKYATWLRKVEVEMEEGEEGSTLPPPSSSTTTTTTRIPTPLVTPTAAAAAAAAATLPAQPKYQYYQTPTHLTVTLLQKGLKEGEASVVIEPRRLTIKGNDGSTMLLEKQLFDAVIPKKCVSKFFATKLEIKLKKATEGLPWADLSASSSSAASIPMMQPPSSSTSSSSGASSSSSSSSKPMRPYASQKDWGAVEREITKELESEKPEGEEALNKLFKDIYSNASDDTRRAMVKSYQTSGGTVLSTNWGEVAKKDYENDEERKAPEGMEWRKWGV